MMDALYNFFACALGQFAAYVYFSSRFELKRPRALGIVFLRRRPFSLLLALRDLPH